MSAPNIIVPPGGGGGGTVTGTGTPGKLAKFATASSIGDSVVTELAGKIGINVVPGTLLSVGDGIVSPPSYDGIRLGNTAEALFSSSDSIRGFRAGVTGATVVAGSTTSHDLLLQRGNVTALTLGASGAVAFAGNLTSSAAQTWTLAAGSTSALNIQSGLLNLDTANSRVGVGVTDPGVLLEVYGSGAAYPGIIRASGNGVGGTSAFQAAKFSTDADGSVFQFIKHRGTRAAPTTVATGDILGSSQYVAYGGTNFRTLSQIVAGVTAYASDSNISSYLSFATSTAGSAAGTEKMRIDATGNVGINTAIPLALLHTDVDSGQSVLAGLFARNTNTSRKGGVRIYACADAAGGNIVFSGSVNTTTGNTEPATMTSDGPGVRAVGAFCWSAGSLAASRFYFSGSERTVGAQPTVELFSIYGSGNVSLGGGTTVPTDRLMVTGGGVAISGNVTGSTTTANTLVMDTIGGQSRFFSLGASTSAYGGYVFYVSKSGASPAAISGHAIDGTGASTFRTVANPNAYTIVAQDDIAIYTGTDATGTTSLRLGSSGSLPQGCAAVKGTKTAAGASGTMTFQTASGGVLGDKMTIDATGNLLMAGGGSAAAPIIANSTGVSGMYFPSAQTTAIVANGAIAATFSKVAGAGVALGGTTGLVFDASGTQQGIKLATTPGNTDPNTLDGYFEAPAAATAGTGWTPALSAAGFWGGTLPVVDYARYIRVGSIVFVHVQLSGAALTVATFGGATISLPTGIAINTYANQAVVTTNTNNGASGTGVAGAGNIYSPAFAACTRVTFQFFYFTN